MPVDERTNPFVKKFFEEQNKRGSRAIAKPNVDADTPAPPDSRPLKVRKYVGLLGRVVNGERELYDGDEMTSGVLIPEASIVFEHQLPLGPESGLAMDVVYADADADVVYFSSKPFHRHRQPPGGGPDPDPFPLI